MEESPRTRTSHDGSHFRLSRLLNLVQLLSNGLRQNASELAELLETSRRTVFRDLQVLREAGVPLAYDSKSQKYRLEQGFQCRLGVHVPDILSFAIALAAAKRSSKLQAIVTLFESELADHLSLSVRSKFQSATEWVRNECRVTSTVVADHLIETLFAGYLSRTKVRIVYEIASSDSQGTLLSPHALILTDSGFEVSGWSSYHRGMIRVSLDKMISIEATEDPFSMPVHGSDS